MRNASHSTPRTDEVVVFDGEAVADATASGDVANVGDVSSISGKATGAMPVAERFISINGEGPNAGKQAAFIRFRGCNLDCSWCDTRWACLPECPVEQLSVPSLVAFVTESDVHFVTLTGGEPLLQPLLGELIRALLQVPHLTVEVETNGSLSVAALDEIRREPRNAASSSCLSFTMDWKLPGSGMEQRMDASRFAPLGSDDSVKFVVGSNEDIDAAARVIREANLEQRCRVFLSPVAGAIEPAQVVCRMTELHLNDVALQLQLHKIIWPNETKGV